MIQLFYILLLIVFGGLNIVILILYAVKASALREELETVEASIERHRHRLRNVREEFANLKFDNDLLEEEKRALEIRETCLQNLEEFCHDSINESTSD